MKLIPILLVMLFCQVLSAEELLKLKAIPKEPRVGKTFVFEVANVSKKAVKFDGVSIYRITDKGETVVRADTSCPCKTTCNSSVALLNPGGYVVEAWEFKDNACKFVPVPGVYQAKILGTVRGGDGKQILLGKTGTFEVKNKEKK